MSVPRPAAASLLLCSVALALAVAWAGPAAAGRIELPTTDGPAAETRVAPRAPVVFATPGGLRVLDLANPMREIAPGVYEGIVPFQLPDGSWQVDLDERFMQFSVAHMGAGGRATHGCVGDLAALQRWQRALELHPTSRASASGRVPTVSGPEGARAATWEAR